MTTIDRIVIRPQVTAVASNRMLLAGLNQWLAAEGLNELGSDKSTPLGKIVTEVQAEAAGEPTIHPTTDLLPEFAGRFCYRSWAKGRETRDYIENIKESGHGSVLEHGVITLAISGVSRALTHELIRHRAGFAVSQESQRYVDRSPTWRRSTSPPIPTCSRPSGCRRSSTRRS